MPGTSQAARDPRQPRARVLFAADHADLRRHDVRRLLGAFHDLELASDGEIALGTALRDPPELVLADVSLPRLDGFALLRALQADARTRDVPVILLSAHADEAVRVDGLEHGASDFLVEPFGARELLSRVEARLEVARLKRQMFEREQRLRAAAEESAARLRAELAATRRLHEFSTRLTDGAELEPLLHEVLDACIELLSADFGNVQLYDAEACALRIVAQRGFDQHFLDYFARVPPGTGSCGCALQRRSRVVIEDVFAHPLFAQHLHMMRAADCRAVQSTPLISRGGELLGMLSTHYRRRHRPSERELDLLDIYARQAAELIERRRAEERLRRSEDRFRHYFDLGLIGGALTSPDKACLEVNDELCRILGYTRSELIGKSWVVLTHPDDVAAEAAHVERVLAGEIDGYTLDKRWVRKDGTLIESMMTAQAVRRADGSVEYFVGLVRDITARKRVEESLQRLQADLAHVTRVTTMGEMATSIAHELNQPLAAIIANASAAGRWLAREPSHVLEATQAIKRIVSDAERASDVIARIRQFVRRRGLQCDPLDLPEIAREAVAMVEVDLHRHGVSFSMATAAQLPPVVGDRVQLQQVILNLIVNAIDALDAVTGRRRTLELKVFAYGPDELCVAVRDAGIGIPRAERERIFEAFHTTKPSGMGMGLAISRSIVEAHGGRLWATPNEQFGETFRFTLPASVREE